MKYIELQNAEGKPLTTEDLFLGTLRVGETSRQQAIRIANVGDEKLIGVRAYIVQDKAVGLLRAAVKGIGITGTSEADATPLPDIEVGQYLEGWVTSHEPTVPSVLATLTVVAT